jgi:hypothetical protein
LLWTDGVGKGAIYGVATPKDGNVSVQSKDESVVTAPFLGWSPERQDRVDRFNLQEAYKKLPKLMQDWTSVRWFLNDYYERTDKSAICERKRMRGEPCPQEHPLNESTCTAKGGSKQETFQMGRWNNKALGRYKLV